MKRVLPWWVRWTCRACPRDFVLPWLLQSPQYKVFVSSPYIISIPLSLSPSKLGRQPCWVACLLIRVSGHPQHISLPYEGNFLYCPLYLHLWSLYSFVWMFNKGSCLIPSMEPSKRDVVRQLCFCCTQPWLKIICCEKNCIFENAPDSNETIFNSCKRKSFIFE